MQTSSEKFAEWLASMRPAMPDQWQRLVETIIRAAEEVHRLLGPGLPCELYGVALARELQLVGAAVEHDRPVPLSYKGTPLPEQRISLVVNSIAAVEVCPAERINETSVAGFDALLRAADLPVGLLLDFNVLQLRNGVYRRMNRTASESLALITDTSAESAA